MKQFIFVIPVMVLVYSIAMWMLNKDYPMIDTQVQMLISVGPSVISGLITFILMRRDVERITDAHRERKESKRSNK